MAPRFSQTALLLDESSLRTFFTLGGRHVLAIEGLRLAPPYDISPCAAGRSRWVRRALAASDGSCAGETALDTSTRATLAGRITAATGFGETVRDVYPLGGQCSDVSSSGALARGATVSVGGACWEHVHPDELSVYDFTAWVETHPGNGLFAANANPIAAFALGGGVALRYPASHPMDRWAARRGGFGSSLGVLGETVLFAGLPEGLQQDDVADALGAERVASGDLSALGEACGSPGEVANEPLKGNMYRVYSTGDDSDGTPSDQTDFKNRDDAKVRLGRDITARGGKNNVWAMVAMEAPDQLRQRAAWALAQIFVVTPARVELEIS